MNKAVVVKGFKYLLLTGLLIVATLLLLPKDPYGLESYVEPNPITPKKVQNSQKEYTYSLLFMGDTMLARGIGASIVSGSDPFQYVSEKLSLYDIKIANIETTIAPNNVAKQVESKAYTFNAPLQSLDVLKKHITVGVLANNHTRDFGAAATSAMLDVLQEKQIPYVGAGKTIEEAYKATFVTLKKDEQASPVKIAILAFNDIENFYTNVLNSMAGSAYFDQDKIKNSIKDAKDNGADLIIVIPHWGVEYSKTPSVRQKEWARFFIDNGADLVVGGHPHVVQTTDQYVGKTIIYSLGNFIFDGMEGDARKGNMISVNIKTKELYKQKKLYKKDVEIGEITEIPISIDAKGFPHLEK